MVLEDGHQATGDGTVGATCTDVEREDGVDEEIEESVDLGLEESPDAETRRGLFLHAAATALAGWWCGEVVLVDQVSFAPIRSTVRSLMTGREAGRNPKQDDACRGWRRTLTSSSRSSGLSFLCPDFSSSRYIWVSLVVNGMVDV